jgi:hypothetical protein
MGWFFFVCIFGPIGVLFLTRDVLLSAAAFGCGYGFVLGYIWASMHAEVVYHEEVEQEPPSTPPSDW